MPLDGDYINDPLPSSSDKSERIILGAILLDNSVWRQTGKLVTLDFYAPFHRKVFEAMLELAEENQPLEAVLIGEILKRRGQLESSGGVAAIVNLTYGLPQFKSVAPYVEEIKKMTVRREAFKQTGALQAELLKGAITIKQYCRRLLEIESGLRDGFAEETDSFVPIKQVFERDVLPTLSAYHTGRATDFLISTGFPEMDEVLGGGLYLSDFLAVVAPPKSAKSALALQLANNFARAGETCAVLSLEMSNLQNGFRFIAQESYRQSLEKNANLNDAINAGALRPGIFDFTYERAVKIAESLYERNLLLCQKPLAWHELQAEVRRLKREKNLRVLIVDYWQLVNHSRKGNTRAENLGEIAKGLKGLAQELNIVVVALGQFNQEGLKMKASGKGLDPLYLEGSGELVKSANIVLTIEIDASNLTEPNAPRKGKMTFKPVRSAPDSRLRCFFWGTYLTVEIAGKANFDEE